MFKYLVVLAVVVRREACCVDVCSWCLCRDNNSDGEDYLGVNVDCSYKGASILDDSYKLTDTVYSLDLSSNNISKLRPTKLLQSPILTRLNLNNNDLEQIPEGAFKLSELKWLELSNNRLQFIHKEAFSDINNLEYLNLANNRFVSHDNLQLHRLRSLNELVLDGNDLGTSLRVFSLFDRRGFGLTHKIQSLSIRRIDLKEVPDNFFSDAYDIRKLIISDNQLKEIFELPFTLEYLDLSDNPIEEISEEDFADMLALKELYLNNLHIKEVPGFVFDALNSLTVLELERNLNLTVFNPLAFGQEVLEDADDFLLETLSLKGSRLTVLDGRLEEPFGRLTQLDLQGNPWICNCNIQWFQSLQIEPENYEHLRCGSPKTLFNAKIFELSPKNLCPTLNDHQVGMVIAFVAFCVLLTAIALWFFVFIPRYQSRGNCIVSAYTPTANYTMLPLSSQTTSF
ncbi:hypothetical protein ACJJTC_017349 [Scirpophaga incertulas]